MCLNGSGIVTDTQAFDVVTFDFKVTRFRCFVSGSTDYQMNFSHVQNVSIYMITTCNVKI